MNCRAEPLCTLVDLEELTESLNKRIPEISARSSLTAPLSIDLPGPREAVGLRLQLRSLWLLACNAKLDQLFDVSDIRGAHE
eukprot:5531082-Amphidinium_carterae.2